MLTQMTMVRGLTVNVDLANMSSQNIRGLQRLSPCKRCKIRSYFRPYDTSQRDQSETGQNQRPFGVDANGFLEGCRDGREGNTGQLMDGKCLYLVGEMPHFVSF